ncbi:hypothetical protein [Pelosinus sp. IPA-1]|uniref:hypothetical protein n=1 Tax=Pelosinus sp. IPA-1 TaxID=3029569 RepID=UPI00243627BE|nr:hypothetical protein [Pelosinus sp. IPA-1]GMB01436.1 hypothetical protein PIPA1_42350 [Pelosinus sp. IPA-1]
MQTPTPPTKPTPPTPPTMEVKSSSIIGGDAATSPTTSTNPAKSETTKSAQDAKKAEVIPQSSPTKASTSEKSSSPQSQSTASPPLLGTYNETTSATTAASDITPAQKNKPTSIFGFGLISTIVLLFALSFVALHLWNNKKKKERTILDYSESNEKELLDLINSAEGTATPPLPVAMVKNKKKASSKIQGNFEVRI